MKFDGNKYDGEEQVIAALCDAYKFTEESTADNPLVAMAKAAAYAERYANTVEMEFVVPDNPQAGD